MPEASYTHCPADLDAAGEPAGDVASPRVLFRIGPFDVTTRRLVSFLFAIAIIGTVAWFWQRLGLEELLHRARELPAVGVIAAMAVGPLLGFPVSWLHLIAGVRFGFAGGIASVAFVGLCHHVGGWLLVRLLPERCFRSLRPWREKLAGAGHRDAAMLCALLPGMPYTVQLYLLPVMGTPLAMLCFLSVPLHTCRAVVTILLGNYGTDLTPTRITILVCYYLVLLTISTFTVRRLKRTLTHNPSTP